MASLRPALVKGTLTVLKNEWKPLAVGPAAAAADAWLCNRHRANVGAATALYAVAGGAPRPSRTKSAAATHLEPHVFGAVVAQALRGAPADDAANLRALGVESNRVRGEWTGVSLQRHLDLVEALRSAGVGGLAVASRYLWETATSKADVLAFYRGADALAGTGVDIDGPRRRR